MCKLSNVFLEPDENKRKTKPIQIRECSVIIKKIPAKAKTYKGVQIVNSTSMKPTLLKMGKEAGNKVSQKKKNNPAVVIQEKATKVVKRDSKIKLRECSVAIENKKDESAHVLRNRIVKTELKTKTPAPLLETSTFKKNSSKRTQETNSEDEPINVPEMKPTKISERLANRSKSCVVEKTFVSAKPPAKKNKDVPKKVTVSPVQLKDKIGLKNNKPMASTSKLQNKGIDEKKDKTSEKEPSIEAPIKEARLKKKEKTIEAPIKEARLKKKETTIEAPIREPRLKKKNHVPIKIISKHLKNKISNLTEVEVFSSQNEEEESFLAPRTVVQSPIKTPLTKATKKPVNNSLSSNEPQKSPTYRLKLPVADDDDMDDIYDFPMSSSMVENPKAKKVNKSAVKKTRIRQNGKAGSKLELLMKKSTMNVVGNSCHVQNNPEIYKMKQIEMNKLIFAQKTRTNSPKPQLRKLVKQSTVENISDDDDVDDDVIASGSLRNHVDTAIVAASSTFKSPVNKNFSGLVMTNPNTSASPFRISNETIFPRTFYMQLGSDTMPSYSSDCINIPDRKTFNVSSESRKSLESKIPEIFKPVEEAEKNIIQAENDENNAENDENGPVILGTHAEKSHDTITSIPMNNSCESFLGDSNAENVEPVGHKSPSKVRKHISAMKSPLRSTLKSLRSPLKSLPIPSQSEFGAVSSPLVVFNLTAQQLMSPKKIASIKTATNKATEKTTDELKPTKSLDLFDDNVNNEQDDFSKMLAMFDADVDSDQDEPQPCTSKQSEAREHLNFDMKLKEVQNEFGFDELLEESRSGFKSTTSGNNNEDVDDEIKMHLQNLKKYLPSRQNKDRTKEIFATSPLKKTKNLFKSPMIDNLTDIRKAFHASTPVNVLKKQQLMRNIFMNTSKIDIPVDPVEKKASTDQQDEASINQQSEASLNQQDDSVIEVETPEISVLLKEEVVDENFVSSNLFNDQSELFLNVSHIYA